jgi:pimeloyl-ACP methyl ester carboxylesterase
MAGDHPKTHFTRSGDVHIAYQVVGDGPLDLVYVAGWLSHVELAWEEPTLAAFLRRLASFSRLILFDKRGTGLSDRVPDTKLPTLEERMDDVRAVMDAVGSERAALFGFSEGGNMSALFAATYPERTTALIMFGTFAKRIWSPDYPWAPKPEEREETVELVQNNWADLIDLKHYTPSKINDAAFIERTATYFRRSASPGSATALLRMNTQIDTRRVLPVIRVPTLILHRKGDHDANIAEGRWIASQIPGARLVELEGEDHFPWVGDSDAVLDEVEEFLTGERRAFEPDRVLATVMFTDIVGSTKRAASMSDRNWLDLLAQHHAIVRKELARFRGHEIKTAGDGFIATFDGPARAVRCACAIRDGVRQLGLEIRAGLHTGEIELTGKDIAGIAVHIASRVSSTAGASEVVVSSTVKNLVAGSGLNFIDRGRQTLKGIPDQWRLFVTD